MSNFKSYAPPPFESLGVLLSSFHTSKLMWINHEICTTTLRLLTCLHVSVFSAIIGLMYCKTTENRLQSVTALEHLVCVKAIGFVKFDSPVYPYNLTWWDLEQQPLGNSTLISQPHTSFLSLCLLLPLQVPLHPCLYFTVSPM